MTHEPPQDVHPSKEECCPGCSVRIRLPDQIKKVVAHLAVDHGVSQQKMLVLLITEGLNAFTRK